MSTDETVCVCPRASVRGCPHAGARARACVCVCVRVRVYVCVCACAIAHSGAAYVGENLQNLSS
jgi:hypothetical protein